MTDLVIRGETAAEPTAWRSTVRPWLALIAIMAVALGLRVWGIDMGRPFSYHPDEYAVLNPALDIVRTGDWNPHLFWYPSALIYAESAIVAVVHAFQGLPLDTAISTGVAGLPVRAASDLPTDQFPYLLAGRYLVATVGVLMVPVVFLAARRLASTPGALGAAAIVAVAPSAVVHSHFLTTDVPAATLAGTTLLLALIGRDRGARWLVAAGATAGLAASTKYNAGLVVMVPLIIQLGTVTRPRDMISLRFAGVVGLIVASSMVAFAAATPAILFDTSSVLAAIQLQAEGVSEGHAGAEGESLQYYFGYLFTQGIGPVISLIVVLGALRAVRRHGTGDLAVLVFTVSYLALISAQLVRFDRHLLPVIPFLAVLGGIGVDGVLAFARRIAEAPRLPRSGWLAGVAVAAIMVAAIGQPLLYDIDFARNQQRLDTRTQALEWIRANIPPGTAIIRENRTPIVPADEYRVGFISLLGRQSVEWYRQKGARYLIASSFQFDRFKDHPLPAAFYDELFSLPIVYDTPASLLTQGPRIVIVDLGPGDGD